MQLLTLKNTSGLRSFDLLDCTYAYSYLLFSGFLPHRLPLFCHLQWIGDLNPGQRRSEHHLIITAMAWKVRVQILDRDGEFHIFSILRNMVSHCHALSCHPRTGSYTLRSLKSHWRRFCSRRHSSSQSYSSERCPQKEKHVLHKMTTVMPSGMNRCTPNKEDRRPGRVSPPAIEKLRPVPDDKVLSWETFPPKTGGGSTIAAASCSRGPGKKLGISFHSS